MSKATDSSLQDSTASSTSTGEESTSATSSSSTTRETSSPTPTETAPDKPQEPEQEPEPEPKDRKVTEARKYRQRAQQAEAEADKLREQLDGLRQQLVSAELATSGRGVTLDAVTAAGHDVSDLFDGSEVNRDKLAAAVDATADRFGIRTGIVPTQGTGSTAPRASESNSKSWSDAFARVSPAGENHQVFED